MLIDSQKHRTNYVSLTKRMHCLITIKQSLDYAVHIRPSATLSSTLAQFHANYRHTWALILNSPGAFRIIKNEINFPTTVKDAVRS